MMSGMVTCKIVNYINKTVEVYFLIESSRSPNVFVRESCGRGA